MYAQSNQVPRRAMIMAGPPPLERGASAADIANRLADSFEQFKNANDRGLTAIQKRLDDIELRLNRVSIGGGTSIQDQEEAARRFFAMAKGREPNTGEFSAETYCEYRNAFRQYLRHGDRGLAAQIQNALSVGSDPAGGFLVTTEMETSFRTRAFETSPMRQIADSITIGTSAWEQPLDTNDATTGGWVGEREARPQTDTPEVGKQRIEVHEQYAYPEVYQNALDDAFLDLEAWLGGKISDKLDRTESAAFVTGDGEMKPKGFLAYKDTAVTTDDAIRAWGLLQYIPSGAAGGFPKISGSTSDDADAMITTVHMLKKIYRAGAVWTMNKQTAALVRKLKDADGRWLWSDAVEEGQPDRLLGYPVEELEDMPDPASDAFPIAFGNFRRGYLIVDRQGMRVLRDPYTSKGKVGFYSTKRVGGDVVDFDAIKLMKFATS